MPRAGPPGVRATFQTHPRESPASPSSLLHPGWKKSQAFHRIVEHSSLEWLLLVLAPLELQADTWCGTPFSEWRRQAPPPMHLFEIGAHRPDEQHLALDLLFCFLLCSIVTVALLTWVPRNNTRFSRRGLVRFIQDRGLESSPMPTVRPLGGGQREMLLSVPEQNVASCEGRWQLAGVGALLEAAPLLSCPVGCCSSRWLEGNSPTLVPLESASLCPSLSVAQSAGHVALWCVSVQGGFSFLYSTAGCWVRAPSQRPRNGGSLTAWRHSFCLPDAGRGLPTSNHCSHRLGEECSTEEGHRLQWDVPAPVVSLVPPRLSAAGAPFYPSQPVYQSAPIIVPTQQQQPPPPAKREKKTVREP